MDIGTIHFLVHPGSMVTGLGRRTTQKIAEFFEESRRRQLGVYESKVDSLGENDVLVVVRGSEREEADSAGDGLNISDRISDYGRRRLGNRCVIVREPVTEEKVAGVRAELEENSLLITANTSAEAWGEDPASCVASVGDLFFEGLDLKSYPVIPIKSTSKYEYNAAEIERLGSDLRRQFPNSKVVDRL